MQRHPGGQIKGESAVPTGVYDRRRGTLREIIESRADPVPESGCWLWTYSLNNKGYGRLAFNGKPRLVHRLAYTEYNGAIPEGMSVCHKCDTPSCVNPTHLFLGTQSDNAIDMVRKMRSYVAFEKAKTHCNRGHELSGENLYVHKSTGRRQCKACARITSEERRKCSEK